MQESGIIALDMVAGGRQPTVSQTLGAAEAGVLRRREGRRLAVEPDVLEAPAVVDAVGLDSVVPDVGLPAAGRHLVENDRAGDVFLELPVDLPHHFPALLLI